MTVEPILELRDVTIAFDSASRPFIAASRVSFSVEAGETFAIVGESGSGKTVTALSILGLLEAPGRVTEGQIRLNGANLLSLSERRLRGIRGKEIAMIFQDPMTTLHPLLRIEEQMVDAVRAHRDVPKQIACQMAAEALARVGISLPEERLRAYPHQLSGGMRQRVAIAIAMINRPALIVADEPTTALDVTTQAQIIFEMKKLCSESGTALVWITHDLGVVSEIADRVAVMYAGSIVETGPAAEVLSQPGHPYTLGLLGSIPGNNRGARRLPQISGSVQSAYSAPGCRFAPRCAFQTPECAVLPALTGIAPRRAARCIHPRFNLDERQWPNDAS
jgi:peptide/nickel transport system ATP-binding protein